MDTVLNDKDKQNLINYGEYLIKFLQDTLKLTGAKGYVLGVSGGVDSGLIAALLSKACPNNHIAIYMPCESSNLDEECVNQLTNQFKLNFKTVDLNNSFKTFVNQLGNVSTFAKNNIKPRLRMTTLYSYANSLNYLVLGTDNLCEWHVGYFTKHGDGACDVFTLIHLNKQEVKFLAKQYGVPEIIINRDPSASLWENQTDEKEMGISYADLNAFLKNKPIPKDVENKINQLHKKSEHKRQEAIKPIKFN